MVDNHIKPLKRTDDDTLSLVFLRLNERVKTFLVTMSGIWLEHSMKSVEHYGLETHGRFYTGHHFETC